MSKFSDLFGKQIASPNGRYLTIEETKFPLKNTENVDLKSGDTVVLEVEVTVSEPAIDGFRGLVHTVEQKGFRFLSDLQVPEEET